MSPFPGKELCRRPARPAPSLSHGDGRHFCTLVGSSIPTLRKVTAKLSLLFLPLDPGVTWSSQQHLAACLAFRCCSLFLLLRQCCMLEAEEGRAAPRAPAPHRSSARPGLAAIAASRSPLCVRRGPQPLCGDGQDSWLPLSAGLWQRPALSPHWENVL